MKQFSLTAVCLLLLSLSSFAADKAPTVETLSAQEKGMWEAIKNNDMKAFSAGTASEILSVDASGVIMTKAQLMEMFAKVKTTAYELSDFSVFVLDSDCVVLSYKASFTGIMDGQTMSMKTMTTTTYIKEGGKWIPKFHTETPIMEMPAPK